MSVEICSFCGKNSDEPRVMIKASAMNAVICSECISTYMAMIIKESQKKEPVHLYSTCCHSPATQREEIDILLVSSGLLKVIRSELSARGLKPAPGHIRWVFSVIEKALPTDDLFS